MGITPIDSEQMQVKNSRSAFRIEDPSSSGVELPLELITEILLRLPVKSLLKSKCVSKPWRCLISSPEFIRSHFSLSSSREGQYTNHQLLLITESLHPVIKGCFLNSTLHEPSTHVYDVDCPFLNPDDDGCIWIGGMINGLICLSIEDEEFFIWNPVLRKFKHLPSPDVTSPSSSYVISGFGYDVTNDDYKVVCVQSLQHTGGADETQVKVYSLLADSWRTIEGTIPWHSGKYANGKIHWATWESSALCKNWKIVTLDMVSDKFGELKPPGCVDYDDCVFDAVGGRLFVLGGYNLKKNMDLWVMDMHGAEESWSKVVSIPYVDVHAPEPEQVLCVLRNGEIVLANGSCLLVYRPKHNVLRHVVLGGCRYFEAFVYVESLVWPNESCL